MLSINQIAYAPASVIVAEVEELKKSNAPKSIVEVLLHILEERKEMLSAKTIAMKKIALEIPHLISDIRYYENELASIEAVQKANIV